jgi:RHH-type proline utilization regulon transcriptional repressor/proline dehydrogenase/delta 1-pyrroline-5-carboxylate dehydrogenase
MKNGDRQFDAIACEAAAQRLGRQLLERASAYRPSWFSRRYWEEHFQESLFRDPHVKVQVFRFVDVLPMLTDGDVLARHFREYFGPIAPRLPWPLSWLTQVACSTDTTARLAGKLARRQILRQAQTFIAGDNATQVLAAAKRQRQLGRAFTLDLLGEAVISDVEAEHYFKHYLKLLNEIAPQVNNWPEVPLLDRAPFGKLPRANFSLKLSALDGHFDALDAAGSTERALQRLRPLLRAAKQQGAFINIDMESYATKDLTLATFKQVLMEDEFCGWSDVGIVIQCYLRDAAADLEQLRDWARQRGTPVWVRLVKGAYWDYETVHAQAAGWPVPVFQQKWQSDASFESLSRFALQNHSHLRTALGSHNIRSLAYGLAVAESLGLPPGTVEIQMLHGMADDQKRAIVEQGHRLRVYMPFGELIPGMAYLVRRLLENTANESFLRARSVSQTNVEELLMAPQQTSTPAPQPVPDVSVVKKIGETKSTPEFFNEPLADFAQADVRQQFADALAEVQSQFGQHYPLVINGQPVGSDDKLVSVNPSHRRQVVGEVAAATAAQAEQAIAAAKRAFTNWATLPASARADFIRAAAQVMRERRFELAAWIVCEVGKGWVEADADVCEAIDFCEYYATGAEMLDAPHGLDVPGEENRFIYLPRGVAAVIAPWNFPLAILTGMSVAALATGNTVVMKPAEQSSVVAAKLMEVFLVAGLPPGVVNLLPGQGEIIGPVLVEHPDVALIAFTGSRAVGLEINKRASAVLANNATSIKKVIAELGGKNAIIIDDDADLDEAVLGVAHSAFGYQGQKCSACSRAIVVGDVYDTFVQRLVETTRSLRVGPAEDPASQVGPVIDETSLERIHRYIERGKQTARLAIGVEVGTLADEGFFIGPHVFADVAPDDALSQDEIFGPVLAVMRAKNLDDAFAILNGTDYALTGGIFSRSPANLQRARRELLVGNLYLNRGITGALVARQPFGGFKMSGIGSKAGSSDYLLQFVLPRTITENTLRRGFAPPSE